ncbi:hypothetical protein AGMMS49546_30570 [Spirochaetia bacterium]|nr:hypothetical protein AGMMS49546_30570 [Spirochaetia bacterium]
MKKDYTFAFGGANTPGAVSEVHIQDHIPALEAILQDMTPGAAIHTPGAAANTPGPAALLVCDENTLPIARKIIGNAGEQAVCVLKSGEEKKNWASAEKILLAAKEAGLGRDGIFIAAGGGVLSDLTGFAASIYMRGARLCIVSTTLLGMVDAALGGKTGFDLFGAKNFAGTFFPAAQIYLPMESLASLPPRRMEIRYGGTHQDRRSGSG